MNSRFAQTLCVRAKAHASRTANLALLARILYLMAPHAERTPRLTLTVGVRRGVRRDRFDLPQQ